MRITQVISHYVPAHRFGGPLQVAHGLAKAFLARGHTVSVCTTNLADETHDLEVPLNEPVDVDGVEVHYSPTCWSRYWGFSPELWKQATVEIEKADVVLVHFHYQFANWAGAHLARRRRKPYAVFAHGSLKNDAIRRKGHWKKSLYLQVAERRNLGRANWIFFNAAEEQQASRYAAQGQVLPSGVDLSEFEQPIERSCFRARFPQLDGKMIVLFLGRIDYQGKGLDKLLPAFKQFQTNNPHAHLVLAGPDERGGRVQTETLVAQLNLQDCVTLTGLLRGTERIAALRESDIFVLPSPSEGLSISLLEALYVGIPVVVTDRVGMSGQVARTGAGIVAQSETGSLSAALTRLATVEARRRMQGQATELVRLQFSWNAVAGQLLSLMEQEPSLRRRSVDPSLPPSAVEASA